MAAPPGRLSVGESRDSATASAVDSVNQGKIHGERLGGSRGNGAGGHAGYCVTTAAQSAHWEESGDG